MSQKGVILMFLELGNFSLKLGKNILFAIGNRTQYQSSKWAKKPGWSGKGKTKLSSWMKVFRINPEFKILRLTFYSLSD